MRASLQTWLREWACTLRLQVGALLASVNLGVVIYLLIYHALGITAPFFDFWANMGHWLIVFSLASLPLMFSMPSPYRRFWLAYAMPGAVVCLVWYGPMVLRYFQPSASPSANALTLMSYNIGAMPNIEALMNIITTTQPDILALQEMRNIDWRSALLTHYEDSRFRKGLAVFSQYPIQSVDYLGEDPAQFKHMVGLRVRLDWSGTPIVVYSVHLVRPRSQLAFLDYDASQRHRGLELILESLRQETHPTLLLCDCNMSDHTHAYGQLSGVMVDLWRQTGRGWGLTAPPNQPFPLIRSDYIWLDAAWQGQRVERYLTSASDHYPLRGWVNLKGAERPPTEPR